jgi:hypothetical protein
MLRKLRALFTREQPMTEEEFLKQMAVMKERIRILRAKSQRQLATQNRQNTNERTPT